MSLTRTQFVQNSRGERTTLATVQAAAIPREGDTLMFLDQGYMVQTVAWALNNNELGAYVELILVDELGEVK